MNSSKNSPHLYQRKKFFAIAGLCIILSIISTVIAVKIFPGCLTACVPLDDVDVLEYQTQAVNLAALNRFPELGFAGNESIYGFCNDSATGNKVISEVIAPALKSYGPVISFNTPPLTSLFAGCVYKAFGVNHKYFQLVQLLLIAMVSISFPFAGFQWLRISGAIAGCIAGVMFFWMKLPYVHLIASDILLSSLVYLAFIIYCATLGNAPKWYTFFLLGLIFGLALLTKGLVLPLIIMYVTYLIAFSRYKFYNALKFTACILAGLLLVTVPWSVYANVVSAKTLPERTSWQKHIWALTDTPQLKDGPVDLGKDHSAVKYLVAYWYSRYADTQGPLIWSNQVGRIGSSDILAVHNEKAVDGWWHPEWVLEKGLYHNKYHTNENVIWRICHFYHDNPSLLLRIAFAKLRHINLQTNQYANQKRTTNPFFWLAMNMFGIMMIYGRLFEKINAHNGLRAFSILLFLFIFVSAFFTATWHILLSLILLITGILLYRPGDERWSPVLIPIALLSSLATVILFWGNNKFVEYIDSICFFSGIYFAALFFISVVKRTHPNFATNGASV